MQLLSETLMLTSESAHLLDSGYLFWQVSSKQSPPLTQILGLCSSLVIEGPFLPGLSSIEHPMLFLGLGLALEKTLQLTLE